MNLFFIARIPIRKLIETRELLKILNWNEGTSN